MRHIFYSNPTVVPHLQKIALSDTAACTCIYGMSVSMGTTNSSKGTTWYYYIGTGITWVKVGPILMIATADPPEFSLPIQC